MIWNASPSTLINVSKSMICTPTFMGPGLTNGLNLVANAGLPQHRQRRTSTRTFPGLDVMRRNAEFVRDYRDKNNAEPDDIGAAIYAIERQVVAMLQAAGKDLSREGFLVGVTRKKNFTTGVLPPDQLHLPVRWHGDAPAAGRLQQARVRHGPPERATLGRRTWTTSPASSRSR